MTDAATAAAAPADGATPPTGDNSNTPPADAPSADSVAKLEKALASEREARRKAESDAKAGRTATERLAEIDAANATELDKAVNAARKEGETAATARFNSLLVGSEARALAASLKFNDPTDAVRFLNLSDIEVKDDGAVDSDAIKAALDDLAKSKPYLLTTDKPDPTHRDAGIGAAGGDPAKTDPRVARRQQMEADIKAGRRRS